MIYCVEDDESIRELMLYTLDTAGLESRGFNDGKELNAAISVEVPDLIMLDIMLPGESGISILKRLKENFRTKDIPVIMATAKGTEFDKVKGLDLGADDYLVKPFGMMEMVSRIKAVLRRTAPKQAKVISYGGITLDEGKHTVTVNDTPVTLTLKEYEILKLLMDNPGQVFTREILLSDVWGIDFTGETRTVDVHIGTLRTKLAEAGDMIETVRGVGYKMGEKN
jgi:two-component system alkaline phosphatase synthesis response regulator PhoP